MLVYVDFDEAALIRSLRHVEPVSSFRTTFAYTNITHRLAGRVVAKAAGAPDWNAVLRQELLDPLGMKDSSYTAEAIEAAANHAKGHRWTPEGTIEVPFTPIFPYALGGAATSTRRSRTWRVGSACSSAAALSKGAGSSPPRTSPFTRTPKVAVNDQTSYALGWFISQTPNGNIVWHNGDAVSFGSFVGMVPDKKIGVVILTNEEHVGFPDAIGQWVLDRLLGNPEHDYPADKFKEEAKIAFERKVERYLPKPASPRPFPPLAPFAGKFVNPSFGEATVAQDGDALVMELHATGAKLKLEPWDGDVFIASSCRPADSRRSSTWTI